MARSPEVKALGVELGTPIFKIQGLVHQHGIAVLSSNYALYGDMSERIMTIIRDSVPELEVYSIDEAFVRLDGVRDPYILAEKLRAKLHRWTGVPTSIGISTTRVLAKVANKRAKKTSGGVVELTDHRQIDDVLGDTPVCDIWGIGPRHTATLGAFNIHTARQFRDASPKWVRQRFTVVGARIQQELQGVPCIPLEQQPQPRREIITSRSFGRPVTALAEMREAIASFTSIAAAKLRAQQSVCNILHVFLNTDHFREDVPQHHDWAMCTLPYPSDSTPELIGYALQAIEKLFLPWFAYKKAGVVLRGIVPNIQQSTLFESETRILSKELSHTMDRINARFGRDMLRVASTGLQRSWDMRRSHRSKSYTTRWTDLLTINMDTYATGKNSTYR